MEKYFGENIPKLGFGLMRLPKLPDGKIDLETTKEMVDLFMAGGQTYFDTAYVYNDGDSERAAKAALVDRYPRESFQLATKLNAWIKGADEESSKQQFFTSLERTGAGYFDFFLLHALQPETYKKYEEYHLWDFVREQKEKGLIRHWGFSFHATPEILDEVFTEHPDAEFVQLQLNYVDWENPSVAARECYEVARKHGKSVVVMEPVKGGQLAEPIPAVRELLDAAAPGASYASWAIRFAASLDGIITVLSGMSTVEQVRDNLSYMRDFQPLSEAEQGVLEKARQVMKEVKSIPCTACHYCTAGCPAGIPIPEIFAARNLQLVWGEKEDGEEAYRKEEEGRDGAGDCIQCGQCEAACPQQIDVIARLEDCAEAFEKK